MPELNNNDENVIYKALNTEVFKRYTYNTMVRQCPALVKANF